MRADRIWSSFKDLPLLGRLFASTVAGVCLFGSIASIAAIRSPAAAQPPPSINGNCNNFGNHNTNCNTFNFGPQKLQFTDALGAVLLAKLPKENGIDILAVGSPSDWNVGQQIYDFLKSNGYQVSIQRAGVLAPPPDGPLVWNTQNSVLTVAPSAR